MTSRSATVAAVDLGATSGRVVAGRFGHSGISIEIVSRFANVPTRTSSGLHWNVLGLYQSTLEGLSKLIRTSPDVASIGVDSWAVDYGLIRGGRLLGPPFHYRDERTTGGVAAVRGVVTEQDLYARCGLQFLPFNTIYQLAVDQSEGHLDAVDSFLLIPDLLNYWLTGAQSCERTNASTTGLLNVNTQQWDMQLIEQLSLPKQIFAPVVAPGEALGESSGYVNSAIGSATGIPVVAVGSHDTASAVVGVPMDSSTSAYISCGTWGLVGVELEGPVLSEASRAANFTNEIGVDGRIRFLRNVMGLWLLSQTIREWERDGQPVDLTLLLEQATAETGEVTIIDANDARFLPDGNMPERIVDYCNEHDLAPPRTRPEFVRTIIESLAVAFAETTRAAAELSGRDVRSVHIVGGGSQNDLLCQATANRLGLDVFAGPAEATAIGNVLVQLRAGGAIAGDLESLRSHVASSFGVRRFSPHSLTRSN